MPAASLRRLPPCGNHPRGRISEDKKTRLEVSRQHKTFRLPAFGRQRASFYWTSCPVELALIRQPYENNNRELSISKATSGSSSASACPQCALRCRSTGLSFTGDRALEQGGASPRADCCLNGNTMRSGPRLPRPRGHAYDLLQDDRAFFTGVRGLIGRTPQKAKAGGTSRKLPGDTLIPALPRLNRFNESTDQHNGQSVSAPFDCAR
jgi:hypothetical protein